MLKNSYNSKSARLAEALLRDVHGEFAAKPFLPSAETLVARYGATRHTVRCAIDNLLERGLLVRNSNRRLLIPQNGSGAEPEPIPKEDTARRLVFSFAYIGPPDPRLNTLTEGIARYMREHDLGLQLVNSTIGFQPVIHALTHPKRFCGDGVIVVAFSTPEYRAALQGLREKRFPVVLSGSEDPQLDLPSVGGDDFGGVYYATMALLQRYDRPAYFFSESGSADTWHRSMAFQKAMIDAGFGAGCQDHLFCLGNDCLKPENWSDERRPHFWQEKIAAILPRLQLPASIVCANDYLAMNLYQAAGRQGFVIGKDLMVVGFDDIPSSRRLSPPLSTIRIDANTQGYRTAQMLHRIATGDPEQAVHWSIPFEYIRRESD